MKRHSIGLAIVVASVGAGDAVSQSFAEGNLFSMSSPEMLALNLAVNGITINADTMLRPTRSGPSDPWERRDAEQSLVQDIDRRMQAYSESFAAHGRGHLMHAVTEFPLALARFHIETQTFTVDLPLAALAPSFIEDAPLSVEPAPMVIFLWKWRDDESASIAEHLCDNRFQEPTETLSRPAGFERLQVDRAPNLFGHPPFNGLSTPMHRRTVCTQLSVDDDEAAREIFRAAADTPLFLNVHCGGLAPVQIGRRGAYEGLESVCIIREASLSKGAPPNTNKLIATWDHDAGEWQFLGD